MGSWLSFLFDHSDDFFCVLDSTGTVLHTNIALRTVLGYTESDLNGKKANEFSHPADIERREKVLSNLSVQKQITGYESRIKAKNGRYHNIKWSFSLSPEDNLVYVV